MAAEKAKYKVKCLVTDGQYQNKEFWHDAVDYTLNAKGVHIQDVDGESHYYPSPRLVRVSVVGLTGGE